MLARHLAKSCNMLMDSCMLPAAQLIHIFLVFFSCPVVSDSLQKPKDCSTLDLSGPHYLPEFAQVYVHCADDAIQTSHPLPPSSPFAFHLSQHRGLFQWVSSSHQVAIRYWSFTLSSSECSGLTSFRIDWFDLLAVQGTLKCRLQPLQLKSLNWKCIPILKMIKLRLQKICQASK